MKLYIITLLLLATTLSYTQDSLLVHLKVGDEAPPIVSPDLFGQKFSSNSIIGEKYLLVSFMGTYCQPCIKEFPELKQLHAKHKDKLSILMVNKGKEDRNDLKKFVIKHELSDFQLVRDRFGKISEPYGVSLVPVTILTNLQGKVVYAQYGAFKEGELFKTLSPLIK